jgi:hypothetical protein
MTDTLTYPLRAYSCGTAPDFHWYSSATKSLQIYNVLATPPNSLLFFFFGEKIFGKREKRVQLLWLHPLFLFSIVEKRPITMLTSVNFALFINSIPENIDREFLSTFRTN